jgi:hypothetical protein
VSVSVDVRAYFGCVASALLIISSNAGVHSRQNACARLLLLFVCVRHHASVLRSVH